MAKITGTAGADVLNGTGSDDIIDGLAGADIMAGAFGHDTYYVDNALDDIVEFIGQGTDWVYTTVSYTLHANVEHARLLPKTANLNLTGNIQDNTLVGNRGNNILNGGGGADTMIGGAGDDTYFINIFALDGINWGRNHIGDLIIDSGGKNDTVAVAVAGDPAADYIYIMQKELEHADFSLLVSSISVTGNGSKNIITTSTGDDTLDGGRNADTMDGGDGANVFYVDHKKDWVIDTFDDIDPLTGALTGADDTLIVKTSTYVLNPAAMIETINVEGNGGFKITGSNSANVITGGAKKDVIHGAGGDDSITGGGGRDTFFGGAGADTFFFETDTFELGAVTIGDFNIGQGDRLDIKDIIAYDPAITVTQFVQITDNGRDSKVMVNTADSGDPVWVHIATIKSVIGLTSETDLAINGVLILQ